MSRQHWTTLDGLRLEGFEEGKGLETVLFLHEFASRADAWKELISGLRDQYRCIAVNARGYPPSEHPKEAKYYSQDALCSDLRIVIDSCETPVHVVGFSMGALTALLSAIQDPSHIKSLVLIGIGTGMSAQTQVATRAKLGQLAELFEQEGSPAVADMAHVISGPLPQEKNAARWEEFKSDLAQLPARPLGLILRQVQLMRPVWDKLRPDLGELKLPILVIAGDRDRECLEAGLSILESAQAAQLAVLPRSGHLLPVEEPDQLKRLISGFLDQTM